MEREPTRPLRRLVRRLLGAGDADPLDALRRRLEEVNAREAWAAERSDVEIREEGERLRARAEEGVPLDDLLVDVFALVRETARRRLGLRPFDVQILGAIALHEGRVAEMQTGEGKTLAAVLPAALSALSGRGVHVLTVNDYLARRDAAWMQPVYGGLGLSVGRIGQGMARDERRSAYGRDVTYLTANEAGFDYLRDHLARRPDDVVQRPYELAIFDEVDSILIDEARIPLVVAGGAAPPDALAHRMAELARRLVRGVDVRTDEELRNAHLTDAGVARVEAELGCGNLFDERNVGLLAALHVALHAQILLHRDVDYVVKGNAVHLVDEFKGRVAEQRRWPDGIHTALEAKEGLPLTHEGRILSSITLQSLAALYPRRAGMTGTGATQAEELRATYGLDVVVVPPNRPCIRLDHPDLLFTHRESKERHLVEEIRALHAAGRPVLVGTASVLESERLFGRLKAEGVPCRVLNARNDEEEAAIVAEAGDVLAVTISTNMAGRGTDIRLGGKREERADAVRALGGLVVLGTNRHESRRIDNQLRGRAGRQGDPGESRFYVSLEDDLMERYGLAEALPESLRAARIAGPVDDPVARRELDRAQRIIEGQNFEIRRNLWKYDLLLEKQRRLVHARREEALFDSPGLLDELAAERAAEVRAAFGAEVLEEVERQITLAEIDRLWSDYLARVAEAREGMPLRTLGERDPVQEFHHSLIEMFDAFLAELDGAVAETFLRVAITKDGIDLEKEGLAAPSSTWTYLVTDQPFGTQMERFARGMKRFVKEVLARTRRG